MRKKYGNRGNKMKSLIKIIAGIILTALLVFSAGSCQKLDVVGNDSVRAFKEMLDVMEDNVTFDEAAGWLFRSPDKSSLFLWGNYGVLIEFDAKPFLDAGLDVTKLPKDQNISYDGNTLVIGAMLWLETPGRGGPVGEATPLSSYERIVREKRDIIGYHSVADHYGVTIGDGNTFEWAKDMSANNKDIVFVLNPKPFINAGVDPDRIEGWVFAKVTIDDENGRPIQVDKILKSFDLF
jgi:hypothetical protein